MEVRPDKETKGRLGQQPKVGVTESKAGRSVWLQMADKVGTRELQGLEEISLFYPPFPSCPLLAGLSRANCPSSST